MSNIFPQERNSQNGRDTGTTFNTNTESWLGDVSPAQYRSLYRTFPQPSSSQIDLDYVSIPVLRVGEIEQENTRQLFNKNDWQAQLYEKVKPSIVDIKIKSGKDTVFTGTGFVVNEDGLIATDQHVSANTGPMTVRFADGRTYSAHVDQSAPSVDLSTIQIDKRFPGEKFQPVELAPTGRALTSGDDVVMFGHPNGWSDIYMSAGKFEAIVTQKEAKISDSEMRNPTRSMLNLQLHGVHGSSGSPIFNRAGQVVGIEDATFDANKATNRAELEIAVTNSKANAVDDLRSLIPGKENATTSDYLIPSKFNFEFSDARIGALSLGAVGLAWGAWKNRNAEGSSAMPEPTKDSIGASQTEQHTIRSAEPASGPWGPVRTAETPSGALGLASRVEQPRTAFGLSRLEPALASGGLSHTLALGNGRPESKFGFSTDESFGGWGDGSKSFAERVQARVEAKIPQPISEGEMVRRAALRDTPRSTGLSFKRTRVEGYFSGGMAAVGALRLYSGDATWFKAAFTNENSTVAEKVSALTSAGGDALMVAGALVSLAPKLRAFGFMTQAAGGVSVVANDVLRYRQYR